MYYDSSNHSLSNLRSELCSSGVTLIDCPSSGRKEAATKMMIGMYFEYTFFLPGVFHLQWTSLRIHGTIRLRKQLLSFLATETWRIWLVPSECASMRLSLCLPMERTQVLLTRPRWILTGWLMVTEGTWTMLVEDNLHLNPPHLIHPLHPINSLHLHSHRHRFPLGMDFFLIIQKTTFCLKPKSSIHPWSNYGECQQPEVARSRFFPILTGSIFLEIWGTHFYQQAYQMACLDWGIVALSPTLRARSDRIQLHLAYILYIPLCPLSTATALGEYHHQRKENNESFR